MDAPVRLPADDPNRFWSKVDKTGECWTWTAFRGQEGYGRFMIKGTPRLAHRVSFELTYGAIPAGAEIDHVCHIRECVRPDHLRLATRSLNAQNVLGARSDSASGIRGVRFRKDTGRWSAAAQVNGKQNWLGTFATAAEAEAAVVEFRRAHMPYSLMDRAEVS